MDVVPEITVIRAPGHVMVDFFKVLKIIFTVETSLMPSVFYVLEYKE